MSNPRGRNDSSYANEAAKLPGLPVVRVPDAALQRFLDAVREHLEVRAGSRGDRFERGITERDLVRLGLVDDATWSGPSRRYTSGGGATPSSQSNGGVLVQTGTGYKVIDFDTFAKVITDGKLFRSLLQRLTDPERFAGLPENVQAFLLREIRAEAALRGADVRRVEEKIQTTQVSSAVALQEVTAALNSAVAGVRETAFASATTAKATAGVVTQISAAIGDPGTFTANGVTLEQAMFGIASIEEGLYGQYTMKIDANGYIAGFGLAVEATGANEATSAFIVSADKFAIVDPSDVIADPLNPPAERIPFGVDTVNDTIFINGNVRINAGGATLDSLGVGVTYWVDPGIGAVTLNAAGTTFSPTTITVSGQQQSGSTISAYSGRFIIATSPDGTTWTDRYTSASDQSSYTWTVTPTSARFIRSRLYQAGGTTTLLDEQTIPVVQAGATGADGKPAITVVVRNAAHAMPADNAGSVTSYTNSRVRIQAWEGGTALTFNTADIGGVSKFYVSSPTVDVGTITAGGYSSGAGTSTYESADHSAMTTDLAQVRWTVTVRRGDGSLDSGSYPAVQTITKARKGDTGATGATGGTGATGATGTRGTRQLYDVSGSYTAAYDYDGAGGVAAGAASYAAKSTDLIATATSGSTPTTPIKGDTVTFTDGSTYTYTNTYNGSAWVPPGVVIDGSLLVTGSVTTTALAANSVTAAKIAAGNITADKITSSASLIGGTAFALGDTTTTVGGVSGAGTFISNNATVYGLVVAQTGSVSGGGGLAAGCNNGSSYAGTFANAAAGFSGNFRAEAYLCNNNEGGWFVKRVSSSNQTVQSQVKLAENGNAIRVLTGLVRIDQAIVTSNGGGAVTYQTNAPTGTSAQTAGWLAGVSANGTEIYIPCIVK